MSIDFEFNRSRLSPRLAYKVSSRRGRGSVGGGGRRRSSIRPISVLEFNSEYHDRVNAGDIEAEYAWLQEYSQHLYETRSRAIGQLEKNKPRNRFVDIIPCKGPLVFVRLKIVRVEYAVPVLQMTTHWSLCKPPDIRPRITSMHRTSR